MNCYKYTTYHKDDFKNFIGFLVDNGISFDAEIVEEVDGDLSQTWYNVIAGYATDDAQKAAGTYIDYEALSFNSIEPCDLDGEALDKIEALESELNDVKKDRDTLRMVLGDIHKSREKLEEQLKAIKVFINSIVK